MNTETAKAIAGRTWADLELFNEPVDSVLSNKIARLIYDKYSDKPQPPRRFRLQALQPQGEIMTPKKQREILDASAIGLIHHQEAVRKVERLMSEPKEEPKPPHPSDQLSKRYLWDQNESYCKKYNHFRDKYNKLLHEENEENKKLREENKQLEGGAEVLAGVNKNQREEIKRLQEANAQLYRMNESQYSQIKNFRAGDKQFALEYTELLESYTARGKKIGQLKVENEKFRVRLSNCGHWAGLAHKRNYGWPWPNTELNNIILEAKNTSEPIDVNPPEGFNGGPPGVFPPHDLSGDLPEEE